MTIVIFISCFDKENTSPNIFEEVEKYEDSVHIFAPNLSEEQNTYKGCFSKNYEKFYFFKLINGRYTPYKSIIRNGSWQNPEVLNYLDSTYSYTYQVINPINNEMVIMSNKRHTLDTIYDDYFDFIFWKIKKNDSLTNLIEIGPPNLLNVYKSQPSLNNDERIYFTASPLRKRKQFYFIEKGSEGYGIALPFKELNEMNQNTNIWIENFAMHPDKKYMIICIREIIDNSLSSRDLYISYNHPNKWTEPVKLNKSGINTDEDEAFPYFSQDGKYFMFTRNRSRFFITSTATFNSWH